MAGAAVRNEERLPAGDEFRIARWTLLRREGREAASASLASTAASGAGVCGAPAGGAAGGVCAGGPVRGACGGGPCAAA